MKKIFFYYLDGYLDKEIALTNDNLKQTAGMKVKCILKDNSEIIGFSDPLTVNDNFHYNGKVYDYIYIWTFNNIDEENHIFIGKGNDKYSKTYKKIFIKDIKCIEAILYSKPDFGTPITNKFNIKKKSGKKPLQKVELPRFLLNF